MPILPLSHFDSTFLDPAQVYMESGERRKVTYVLPVFNEAASIGYFHKTLSHADFRRPDLDFEYVYVDDGSRDASLEVLLELRRHDVRVTVLSLSRNFGHQLAVTAGLDLAGDADAVVVMDTDLQDPPSVSLEMIAMWEDGADVVYAQRRSRRDGAFKRLTAYAFYWTLERLSSIEIPRNVGDFRIMDRSVVAEVVRYREHNRFLRGIVANVGFRQEALLFDRDARHAGETGYPLRKMIAFASNGILGFSSMPLKLSARLGIVVSVISALLGMYVLGIRVFQPHNSVPGWAFLGVGMFSLSGLQFMMIGILGNYLGRVYDEVQGRPLYSIALSSRGNQAAVARRARVKTSPSQGQSHPDGVGAS